MFDLFVSVFVTLFVVIDPPGVAPVFAAMTETGSMAWRRRMAVRANLIALLILLGFAYGGEWLFSRMGVSLDSFRAAGGVLLFLLALDMLFENRTKRREDRVETFKEEHAGEREPEDVSVFPMAIPMIAGPGAIASIMLYMSEARTDWVAQSVVLGALISNLAICFVVFFYIGTVMKAIGPTAAAAITRVFGVILAALSAQLLLDGLKNTFFS
ncbi:MAG: MarC family protein [Maricaulaceae bacterium]